MEWTLSLFILCALLIAQALADLTIFEPGLIANSSDTSLSQGCISALQATIACDPYLQLQVSGDTYGYLPTSLLDILCSPACAQSLASYHNSVKNACANDPWPWQGTPPEHYGDQIWARYNMTCFKDTKGNNCQSKAIHNVALEARSADNRQMSWPI